MTLSASEGSSSNKFYTGLAAGAGLVLVVILAGVLLTRGGGTNPTQQAVHPPFGPAEQAYAAQIHISNLQLSQANNMLNQEFTYVVGTVANAGTRTARAIEVTVEFHDLIHQVVLRDTLPLFPPEAGPLQASRERSFQLTFEHVPPAWNHEAPSIRVTGLDLQ